MQKGIKVLFLNPIVGIDEGVLPMGIAILVSILKSEGHTIELFDTTRFDLEKGHYVRAINEKYLNFLPIKDNREYKKKIKCSESELNELFNQKVDEFCPDVIAVSIICSYSYGLAKKLLKGLKYKDAICILGGKHLTADHEAVINESFVDAVCIGDGENAILEFCRRVANKENYSKINNLWVKSNGNIIKNALAPLVKLDNIPYPNWTLFDEQLFYKPLRGKMYRYGYIEISRGCPFNCPYCHNNKERKLFKGLGKTVRLKSVDRAIKEISYMKNRYNLEMIKFLDEDFLAKPVGYLREFSEKYKKLGLPFLIAIRPERMNRENIKLLKDMGCVQASIGVESGNDYIRKNVYKRDEARDIMIQGFKNFKEVGIYATALNMIGAPYETKKQIFDTIDLNRELLSDDCLVSVFQPYKGTLLRDVCIKEGFISEDEPCEGTTLENSVLNMPQLSKQDIWGFRKTFTLYTRIPKIFYPLMIICRKYDNFLSEVIFLLLAKLFRKKKTMRGLCKGSHPSCSSISGDIFYRRP